MNNVDFLKYPRFPVSSETLQFLQSMTFLAAKMASLGGQNYILDGCADNGTSVTSGTVVINGEILPFAGGAKSANVIVVETKKSVSVYAELYADLYIERVAQFGVGPQQVAWASLSRIPSLLDMLSTLNQKANTVDMTAALGYKANSVHTHTIAQVTGLDNALSQKANVADLGAKILLSGSYDCGDINSTATYSIPFPTQIQGSYRVMGTLRANNLPAGNEGVTWVVSALTPMGFKVTMWEDGRTTQNVSFDYFVIQ